MVIQLKRNYAIFCALLPTSWLAGILICAAIAAMMSTADTQLLVCSSALCEDLYRRCLGNEPGEKTLLLFSRIFTFIICIIALYIAKTGDKTIMAMVSYAWGGLGSSFGPIVILSLYWKKLTRHGVIVGLLFGSIVHILENQIFKFLLRTFFIFVLNFIIILWSVI